MQDSCAYDRELSWQEALPAPRSGDRLWPVSGSMDSEGGLLPGGGFVPGPPALGTAFGSFVTALSVAPCQTLVRFHSTCRSETVRFALQGFFGFGAAAEGCVGAGQFARTVCEARAPDSLPGALESRGQRLYRLRVASPRASVGRDPEPQNSQTR